MSSLFSFMAGTEDAARIERAEAAGQARRAARVDPESDAYNRALLRLVDGKGSTVAALAAVTGLTEDSIKSRVKRARYDYVDTPEDENPFTNADARYLKCYYMNSNDPKARAFVGSINATPRKRPDWRGAADSAPKRGKTTRCRVAK